MAKNDKVAVTYVGNDAPFVDRIYRTGLTFEHGQTRMLPAEIAARLLRHSDVFKMGHAEDTAPERSTGDDDTEALLNKAEADEHEAKARADDRVAIMQSVDQMDREALREFARSKFNFKFPGNLGEEKMRVEIHGLIDRFGVA